MKKLFFIILLCSFSVLLQAQKNYLFELNGKKLAKSQKYAQKSSGDYLRQAGTCYLVGIGVAITGSAISVIDMNSGEINNSAAIIGGTTAVGGLVLTIIGHSKLIKAGKALDAERKITLVPSSSGLGLALKF